MSAPTPPPSGHEGAEASSSSSSSSSSASNSGNNSSSEPMALGGKGGDPVPIEGSLHISGKVLLQVPYPSPDRSPSPSLSHMEHNINESTELLGGRKKNWEFAGSGMFQRYDDIFNQAESDVRNDPDIDFSKKKAAEEKHKLNQFLSTAIAGNDITSSCLYVLGVVGVAGGVLAPFSLLMVAILLYFFRNIYAEVGTALPLNGGAYNALLNTTSKKTASIAACLTILSYVATAVVSANSAANYLVASWASSPPTASLGTGMTDKDWEILGITVSILLFFCLLSLIGITESSVVALVLFFFHLFTLLVLMFSNLVYICKSPQQLQDNWQNMKPANGNYALDLFFGFSVSMLGVSGFETSSNYIEEQRVGVFPKTLRNMWFLVAFFNPVLSTLSFGALPYPAGFDQYTNSLLAAVAEVVVGDWFRIWVCVDAFLVLSGAVLTAYVGVMGLARRMALDRCLPQFLLSENRLRHTNHWIIIIFFLITTSLYLLVHGNTQTLSGVYSVSFLAVMSLFAFANMMLKYKRNKIPRTIRANWFSVLFGFVGVITGLIGNIVYDVEIVAYWSIYFALTLFGVMLMFSRVFLVKVMLYFVRRTFLNRFVGPYFEKLVLSFKNQEVIFFAKVLDPEILNKAVQYVRDNEQTNNIYIVHLFDPEDGPPSELDQSYVAMLDRMYPKMKINLVVVAGHFSPAYVLRISKLLDIPTNFMFMTCPDHKVTHTIKDFGGVRLITH